MSKLFKKPVLVIKSLFYLFWHWFITISYKLQEVTSGKVAIQVCFCKVAGENGKKHLPEVFFKSSNKISPFRSDILTLLKLLGDYAKLAVLLGVLSSFVKVELHSIPLLRFPKYFQMVYGQLDVSATCEKVVRMQVSVFLSVRHLSILSYY